MQTPPPAKGAVPVIGGQRNGEEPLVLEDREQGNSTKGQGGANGKSAIQRTLAPPSTNEQGHTKRSPLKPNKKKSSRSQLNLRGASLMPEIGGQETRGIMLPHQAEVLDQFALDIGGSLAKLVYFEKNKETTAIHRSDGGRRGSLILENPTLGGKLNFVKFQSRSIEECIKFILDKGLHDPEFRPEATVSVTGGGAFKYEKLFKERLGLTMVKHDEMECLIWGLNFFLNSIPFESYTFSPDPADPNPRAFVPIGDSAYPYLLVQIGSGVSVIRVLDENTYERVNGTSLGGGTFWGLCALLTGYTQFDEMLKLADKGDNTRVDLTVGDIYGTDYSRIGLSSDVIASSFGKIMYSLGEDSSTSSKPKARPQDIAMGLLKMVSNNIAQIAYLNAMRFGITRIYFGGFFIRDHPATMSKISFGINFWSKGSMKALFLLHEGYLGAVGAFLKHEEHETVFGVTSPTHLRRRTSTLRPQPAEDESPTAEQHRGEGDKEGHVVAPAPLAEQETPTTTAAVAIQQVPQAKEAAAAEPQAESGGAVGPWVQRITEELRSLFTFNGFKLDVSSNATVTTTSATASASASNHDEEGEADGKAKKGKTNLPTKHNRRDSHSLDVVSDADGSLS
ncbi:Fumble-domain-containing protein [Balamuthia mandrillaris]